MGEIDIILAHSQTTGVRAAAQKGSLEVQDEVWGFAPIKTQLKAPKGTFLTFRCVFMA